jgi:penicillin-insensitive murein endopeptidase
MAAIRLAGALMLALAGAGPGAAQKSPAAALDPDASPDAAPAELAADPPASTKNAKKRPSGPPAKELFGAAKVPAPLQARAIGFYSKGCLAGARPLAIDGPAWQAMRLSRNRNWGHPELVAFVERLADDARRLDGWPGLLVGDMSQPRGGPMLTGHASHQIGLDADIWLTPMPDRRLSHEEREELSATSMLGGDNLTVDPGVWTLGHARLIRRAASFPVVERVLVHPGIKRALCKSAPELGADRTWLYKVRPYWGHYYHMHIRLRCPKDSPGCNAQAPTGSDDGCGKELDDWFKLLARPPKPAAPEPAKPPLALADLPGECRVVLESPETAVTAGAEPPDKAARSGLWKWLPWSQR